MVRGVSGGRVVSGCIGRANDEGVGAREGV